MESQFGIFTTDVNLVVRTWDDWLARITARSAEEICGKAITETFPELESRGLERPFLRAIQDDAVELLAPVFHGYLIACPPQSPSAHFQHMQQRVVIAPVHEETRIVGLVVTIEDVTLRCEREMDFVGAIGDDNWGVRRRAVKDLLEGAEHTPVTELIRRLRKEHRDPGLLNSLLQLLVSGAWETLEPLVELTREQDDAELRMYAALALGQLKDRRAIPALIRLLKDPDTNVIYHAIEACSRLKASEAADELATIAESGEFFLAFPALDALALIGESRIAPRLVPLLENEMLRAAAIGALGKLGDETIVASIVSLMERPRLVMTVAEALVTLHHRYETLYGEGEHIVDLVRRHTSPAAARNMFETLNNVSGENLRVMVRVLGWVGSEQVIDSLTRLLGSSAVRHEVMEMLVRYGKQVTDPLCKQLASEDIEIRRAAVTALGRIGDRKSVPALVDALADPDVTVDAAGALARIGDARAYQPLLQLLSHDSAAVRQAAIGALNSLGHPRTPHDVRKLLLDSNPRVRESAVRIAGYFGYPDSTGLVLESVQDSDEHVRRAAIENLPNLQHESVFVVLKNALRDPSPKIRSAAAQSLGYIESASTLPELTRGLQDPDPWVRYHAARSLGQLRNSEAIDALAAILRNDRANHVRIAAADALGAIGGSRTVSILAPLVESEDADLSRAVLTALGSIGHPDALQPILAVLRSGTSQRLYAVRALAARGDREAVQALQWTACVDPDPSISDAAIDELSRMATPEAITSLVQMTAERLLRERAVAALASSGPLHIEQVAAGLRSPQLEVRRAVIDALGRMKHPTASDMLGRALDDEEPEVRLEAILALRRLGSHSSEKKLLLMARSDSDPGVRKAAERALER